MSGETSKPKKEVSLLLLAGAAGVLLILLFLNFGQGSKKETGQTLPDEKRKNYSHVLINDLTKMDEEKVDAPQPVSIPNQPRNLKTKMGVFIKADEKKEVLKGEREAVDKKGDTSLGITSGIKISAILTHRLFSFNLEAPVLAKTTEDLAVKEKLIIPKGTLFFGEASVLKSIDRINIRFDRFILPDGKESAIRAIALSNDGSSGLKGKVNKQRGTTFLKAMGETALGSAALLSGGFNTNAYSFQDAMRLNASQGLINMAERDLNNVNTESSITVEAFTPFQILFTERT